MIDKRGSVSNSWIDRRNIAVSELWFEKVWQECREKDIDK